MLGLFTAVLAAGCASFTTYVDGFLKGHVLIRWYSRDKFIFIPDKQNPFSFRPSSIKKPSVRCFRVETRNVGISVVMVNIVQLQR
jgi:hypothetical protein